MADQFLVRDIDACGRPVTGVGPDFAQPGATLLGPQPDWLVEQGYLEPVESVSARPTLVSLKTRKSAAAPDALRDAADAQE